MTVLSFEGLTVNELKEILRESELPVSGTKAQLIERLQANHPEANAINLDSEKTLSDGAVEVQEPVPWYRGTEVLTPPALIAIGVAVLMVTAIFVIQPTWLGFEPDYEYELISYDAAQAKNYAEELVSFGHSDWEGRMSGTEEEANVAEYIISQFDSMGMDTTLHSYQVPMHHVNSEPRLRICVQGLGGNSPCEGVGNVLGSDITEFQHRVDYVIQGFSGQSEYTFQQDVQLTYLGNGSDESLWQSATGTIGYVINSGTKTGNTEFFSNAAENNLAGLIRVNKDYNCGKIEGNDCVPIFKGTGLDAVKEANGGSIPSDIPFIAMSKDAGEALEAAIFNATQPAVFEMIMDVTNDQERTIYVPCGEIKGKSSEVIIVGGHHDTVYHGQGAVDDTSGTASVLEMARQISGVVNETGTPERTLRFCTWGGEEEGLYGSRAYVSAFQNSLKDNLRLYINLDMNHVDSDFAARGNSLRLFGNTPEDMEHIERITDLYKYWRSDVADRYDIQIALYNGDKGESDGMPYNSDHGPFVYDLGDNIRGRAVVCYGSGSWEYHTYLDNMERFNEESLGVSVTVYGTYMRFLAYSDY